MVTNTAVFKSRKLRTSVRGNWNFKHRPSGEQRGTTWHRRLHTLFRASYGNV